MISVWHGLPSGVYVDISVDADTAALDVSASSCVYVVISGDVSGTSGVYMCSSLISLATETSDV